MGTDKFVTMYSNTYDECDQVNDERDDHWTQTEGKNIRFTVKKSMKQNK